MAGGKEVACTAQRRNETNPFRAIIATIMNVQVVVMMKRGVNDGRTIPDDALGW